MRNQLILRKFKICLLLCKISYRIGSKRNATINSLWQKHSLHRGLTYLIAFTEYFSLAIKTYDSLDFQMKINLPLLNFTLYIEMTTNIEDYIFMEIENVSVTNDPQVKFNGSNSPVLHSSLNNGENDRAAIDLGYVTVIQNLYLVLLFFLLLMIELLWFFRKPTDEFFNYRCAI